MNFQINNESIKKRCISFIIVAFILCNSTNIISQEDSAKTQPTDTELKDNPGTYLDRHNAIKTAQKMQSQTMRDILKLRTLIANFGDKVDGANKEYENIKSTYKKAQILWYQRLYLKSNDLHKECRGLVNQLYQKFAQMYDKQTSTLLSACSEALVNVEFSQSLEPGKEVNYDHLLQKSSYKLNSAFVQLKRASIQQNNERFETAISHFRLAKLYAIQVLKDLETNPEKRKQMDVKYTTDVQDARGFSIINTASNKK